MSNFRVVTQRRELTVAAALMHLKRSARSDSTPRSSRQPHSEAEFIRGGPGPPSHLRHRHSNIKDDHHALENCKVITIGSVESNRCGQSRPPPPAAFQLPNITPTLSKKSPTTR